MQEHMARAAEDIRLLEVRKQAAHSLRARIRMVEADACSLGSSTSSAVPVRGGGNRQEQRVIGMISRKEKLEKQERALRNMVIQTERALYKLPEQERALLLTFYGSGLRRGDAVRRLERQLHVSQATVYRLRDKALRSVAAMLGYI